MAVYFSVIVPVYKVEEYLRPCVDSILAQTFSDFELLLVDDGSPDGCPEICDLYAQTDARVKVLHQKNSGVIAARKAGLDTAAGKYICFVDSDDYISPEMLRTLYAAAEQNNRPDMLLFDLYHDNNGALCSYDMGIIPGFYDKQRLQTELYPRMLYDASKPFFSKLVTGYLWSKAIKRELAAAHYITDNRIRVHEDVLMVYECLYHAGSVFICPDKLYFYRSNDQSVMSVYRPDALRNLRLCCDYFHTHLETQAPELAPQINAYLVMRVMHFIALELHHGHRFFAMRKNFRREMKLTRLGPELSAAALPPTQKIFVRCVRGGLWTTAAVLGACRYLLSQNDVT